jgi:hypothetical protein
MKVLFVVGYWLFVFFNKQQSGSPLPQGEASPNNQTGLLDQIGGQIDEFCPLLLIAKVRRRF